MYHTVQHPLNVRLDLPPQGKSIHPLHRPDIRKHRLRYPYPLLGTEIGQGYQTATSRHLFRDFIEATAQVYILEKEIVVQFQKRAHNPLLLAGGETAATSLWFMCMVLTQIINMGIQARGAVL